jgi:RNAse (barnase) inhibitor barstar
MAWQVAIVLDENTELTKLLGQMPVWARATPERNGAVAELRADWEKLWYPEPSLTLINSQMPGDPVNGLTDLVFTVEEHHSNLSCVRLFGVEQSISLKKEMTSIGYFATTNNSYPGLGFACSISSLSDVPQFTFNADGWKSANDVYDAFFAAVHAPSWHGRNLDALNDSIATGGINEVEVPYRLTAQNAAKAGLDARMMLNRFKELIDQICAEGCPIEMSIKE